MKIRSGFSFHTAVGHLSDVVARVKELKWKSIPICDTSAFGFIKLTKLAKEADLKPIYGLQIKVDFDYWGFFAKDTLRPLHDLFNKQPLTYEQALAARGVIKVTGPFVDVDKIEPQDDLYIGLSPATSIYQLNTAKRREFKFIATSENVYTRPEDREFYRIVLGKRAGLTTYPQYIMDDEEWETSIKHLTNDAILINLAIMNRDAAMDQCNATLKRAKLLVPDKPKNLKDLCREGAQKLGIDLKDPVYLSRLSHELDVIKKMGNGDYFHIVADMMQYARQHMICGPGRGSSCGSLVCYLLGITTVDPLKYGLLFERFLDVTRTDSLPDIDLDFSDEKRHLVIEYLQGKYGHERVAKLGVVGYFGTKSAINKAGQSLGIVRWDCENAVSQEITRNDGDDRADRTFEDTITTTGPGQKFLSAYPEIKSAFAMESHPNYGGKHAAGVLLTASPIAEHVAVDHDGTAQADMKDAEELGMLKIDALGLTQLSVFERALELING